MSGVRWMGVDRMVGAIVMVGLVLGPASSAWAMSPLDSFKGSPPVHIHRSDRSAVVGLTPAQVKAAYKLPASGGVGTIAIIDAYDDPTAASDVNTFSKQFGLSPLPTCSSASTKSCFEKVPMVSKLRADAGWSLEASLDVEWAHAIAPKSRILLVEAKSVSGSDLVAAVNYAKNRSDVVAISMSWGGKEFAGEADSDSVFTSSSGATFFASAGDSGNGVSWPAVSNNVIAVGGTSLHLDGSNNVTSETAWPGSGGGISKYEPAPAFQSSFGIPKSNGKRAVPDVAYNADPATGFSVYDSTPTQGQSGWFELGGTSAGAPQWAGIRALDSFKINNLYSASPKSFRDITSGTNGSCGTICTATKGYDFVTGLGSPLKHSF